MGVIWKRAPRSFVVHDLGKGDAPADNGCKGMDAVSVGGKRDSDQCLLYRIRKAESLLFSDHVQDIFDAYPASHAHPAG